MTELEMLQETQLDYFRQGLTSVALELVRAGMSEYTPSHLEMLEMGKWALGLVKLLEATEED